jgi:hypothetical protein
LKIVAGLTQPLQGQGAGFFWSSNWNRRPAANRSMTRGRLWPRHAFSKTRADSPYLALQELVSGSLAAVSTLRVSENRARLLTNP